MRYYILIIIMCIAWRAKSQESLTKAWQVGGQIGDILPHSEIIRPLSYSHPVGFSAAMMWQHSRSGQSIEHPLKSRKGIRFQYIHFNNPSQLGNAYCLSLFTEPMFGSNRKLFMSMPIDFGLVGLDNVYHPTENPANQFFSLPVSFYLHVGYQVNYKLSDRSLIYIGGYYQHISNGGIRMPNKGMNFISGQLGFTRYVGHADWRKQSFNKIDKTTLKPWWYLYAVGSTKTFDKTQNLEPIVGLMLNYTKPINYFHGWVLGTELLYNQHQVALEKFRGNQISGWQQSLLGGYALKVGKTSFQVMFGSTLVNKPSEAPILYQRYMLAQSLGKRWQIAGSLKAEAHVADIFDIRLGYRLTR